MRAKEILIYLSLIYEGDQKKMYNHIRDKVKVDNDEVSRVAEPFLDSTISVVDDDYPENWKRIYLPSILIHFRGNKKLLSNENLKRSVTYVGSRDASKAGIEMAREVGKTLAKADVTLISGIARGIDAEVMRGAMEEHGKIIGISGAGIDIDYPSQNADIYDYLKREGLLLSEYPKETKPSPENFPQRNRLLAGLGEVVIVGEAEKRSGSIITANMALEFGKDLGCVPSLPRKESATNALIRDGAYLIDEPMDILTILDGARGEYHL